jgi:hypothetical protein
MPNPTFGSATRWRVGLLVFGMLLVPGIVQDPLRSVLTLVGVAVVAGTVVLFVNRFWRYSAKRLPTRLVGSHSAPVRVATQATRVLATYLVGFYSVIALLLLFTVVNHLL